jgi:hypothetical protein
MWVKIKIIESWGTEADFELYYILSVHSVYGGSERERERECVCEGQHVTSHQVMLLQDVILRRSL